MPARYNSTGGIARRRRKIGQIGFVQATERVKAATFRPIRARCTKRLKRMRVIRVAILTLSNYTTIRPSTTQHVCPVEGISEENPLNK